MGRKKYEVTLPSKGFFNEGKIPNGAMEIFAIRLHEETILSGSSATPEAKLNTVLRSCIASPKVDPLDLLMTDRMFLLAHLYTLSYESQRQVQLQCQGARCGHTFQHVVDLDKLEVKEVPDGAADTWEVALPRSSDKVVLRHLRGRDQQVIRDRARAAKQRRRTSLADGEALPDPTFAVMVTAPVVSVNGEALSTDDLLLWAENLVGADSRVLQEQIFAQDSGIKTDVYAACPACGQEVSTAVPFEQLFPLG
jgi:hypothetical protein